MIGLPDGRKSSKIGLAVLIHYRLWPLLFMMSMAVTDSPSHVTVVYTTAYAVYILRYATGRAGKNLTLCYLI